MGSQRIQEADDVEGGKEKKGKAPDEIKDGFPAEPKSKKATRPLDTEVRFPIGQKDWLELKEAGTEQDHEKAPWQFITETIAG